MRYRKKPIVIEAVQWTGQKLEDLPDWARRSVCESRGVIGEPFSLLISTLEGVVEASHEDWLIRGIKGEVYPCKPDIFAESYEAVADPLTPKEEAHTPAQPSGSLPDTSSLFNNPAASLPSEVAKGVSTPRTLHEQAMHSFNSGNHKEALFLEMAAIELLKDDYGHEPTRSAICVSAASLALILDDCREAERIAALGLSGQPPYEQRLELIRLLRQATHAKELLEYEALHQGLMERFPDHDASAPLENFLVEIDCLKSAFRQLGDLMISQCKESTGE